MRLKARALTIGTLTLALLAGACGGGGDGGPVSTKPTEPGAALQLQGAGASFPNPLYTKWISEYNKKNPNVKIDYQAIGSSGGIKQITERTVDFGATDAPMNEEQLKAAPKEILHIPTVLGAVVVIFNLPDFKGDLKLDGPTTADIFLGNIKKWNDPKIAALNAGATLPATDIGIAYRSDGSGTTAIFADYLSKVSPAWKEKVGTGASLKWPSGFGNKGNDGVAGFVKQTEGAVGYVELIYAESNKLPYASIKNTAGEFIKPSLDAVTAAAAGAAQAIPEDLRVSITNADGAGAYPISGFTWLLVYKDQDDAAKGKAVADFVWWALNDGEKMAKDLTYAPLPAAVLEKAKAKVKMINNAGKPFIT
jgi:phosphate transport system substrate-binding protein